MITCQFEDGGNAKLRHVCVDLLVVNDQSQVLLVKRGLNLSRPGKYTIPGGYLSRDETIGNGALREFEEESGYIAEITELFCINGHSNATIRKDDRQNVVLIFLGKITGGEKQINDEVSEITWFSEDNLPDEEEFAFDHREIIKKYFEYRKSPSPLPLII